MNEAARSPPLRSGFCLVARSRSGPAVCVQREGACPAAGTRLEAFEALPEEDKRVFTVEFLRRAGPYDSGPLEEEEIAQAPHQLVAMLDAEEDVASR